MSSGLLKNWDIIKIRETLAVTTAEEDIGPQVLTMDQLDAAFITCCAPLMMAFIAFVMEILKSRIDSIKSKNVRKPLEVSSKKSIKRVTLK